MNIKGARILVTGGRGFIGTQLMLGLSDAGGLVCGYDLVDGQDVRDYEQLCVAMEGVDIVMHQAASHLVRSRVHPDTDLTTNVLGTLNVLRAAQECGVTRVVVASTGSVHSAVGQPPNTLYGVSKTAAEMYCTYYRTRMRLPIVVLRYFGVVGYGMPVRQRGVMGIFIREAMSGGVLRVRGGQQRRSFVHVLDVVRANVAVLGADAAEGVYEVGSKQSITIQGLADRIVAKYGKGNPTIALESPDVGDDYRAMADTTALEGLGWEAKRTLEDCLDSVAGYIRCMI